MSSDTDRRSQTDRRRAVRGGRRPTDLPGSTPLVLVVGSGANPQRASEAILRELRFAVAPAADLSEAIRVVEGLHPDLIVVRPDEAARLRAMIAVTVPVVEHDGDRADDSGLVERIRDAIRQR